MQNISRDKFVATLDELVCVFYNLNSMRFFCFSGFLLICEPKASIFLCITKKVQKHKSCLIIKVIWPTICVPKVPFRFFDKLKHEIKKSILRLCFYFNKKDEIQITDYHFNV